MLPQHLALQPASKIHDNNIFRILTSEAKLCFRYCRASRICHRVPRDTLGAFLRRHLILNLIFTIINTWALLSLLLLFRDIRAVCVYGRMQEQQRTSTHHSAIAGNCQHNHRDAKLFTRMPTILHTLQKHQINIYASKWPLCRVLQSGFLRIIIVIIFLHRHHSLRSPRLVYFLIFILKSIYVSNEKTRHWPGYY